MKHEELMLLPQKSRISSSHNPGMTHVIRIWEGIGEPNEWTEEIDLINSVGSEDCVVLDVCTPGGYLDTAMLFHRALKNCAAHTIAIIGPETASAGSVIALSAREWILDDTSSLMIHTSSYSLGGKDIDILEHANFSRNQLKRLYENVYSGYLSTEEISDVIKGTPFYFSAEQIAGRLDSLTEYRNSQPCNNPDCQECGIASEELDEEENLTIDEIVEQAVTKALIAYDKQKDEVAKKLARKSKPKPVNPETGEVIVK